MPITRLDNIFQIRNRLLRPYPNAPSFDQLMAQEISEEMDIVNATNNTGIAWATAQYQLNFTPNQNVYQINVNDWGKILYVVKETTNPYIPFIPVPFDDISAMQYGTVWGWFNNSYAQAFALPETPERMSFSRVGVLNPQITVTINPIPQQSATYLLTYLPGFFGTADPLETAIQLPEHAELVRLRAAMALLPAARWYEDEAANMVRRKELAASFDYQLNRPKGKEALFNTYIGSINRPRTVEIDADWNS